MLVGPDNMLPGGANPNAYYTISLVAPGANAKVDFSGDGPSDYADPHFIARSGVTNSVTLLIGKTYDVSASERIEIFGASDPETEIRNFGDGAFEVVRPVYIYPGNGMHEFSMCVEPDDLGGSFTWTDSCCPIVEESPLTFYFDCNRCRCNGCTAEGFYEYEEYRIPTWGGECDCWDDPDGDVLDGARLIVAPCVFLNNDNDRETEEDDLRGISFSTPLPRYCSSDARVTVSCTQGSNRIRLWRNSDRTGAVSLPQTYDATSSCGDSFCIEGVRISDAEDDVTFEMTWTDNCGREQRIVQHTTVAFVTNVLVSSQYQGQSANPPPFAGQREWTFDPQNSMDVDKHLLIPFHNVVNANDFSVRDFDIDLELQILPAGFAAGSAVWYKLEGTPDSGSITNVSGLTAKFSNPKVGGVYRFGVTIGGSPESQCTVVLPLAGAEVTDILQADLVRANGFVESVGGNLTGRDVKLAYVGVRYLATPFTANYLGRADNNDSRTVWRYNGVDTDSSIQNRWDYGGGCVATLMGLPIRIAKLTNLLTGYVSEKLGASTTQQAWGQLPGTSNSSTALLSWMVGVEIVRFGETANRLSDLARYSWQLEEDIKVRRLWPNSHMTDNHSNERPLFNPDYDHNFYSPPYLNNIPTTYRNAYENMHTVDQ